MRALFAILFLSGVLQSQSIRGLDAAPSNLPNAPRPNATRTTAIQTNTAFSSGVGFDNQLYAVQGWGVAIMVGQFTNRPWLGAASGVGSCILWRTVHDQGYRNDGMFSSNRVASCAIGSAAGYATGKGLFHIHRGRR
jgi:hypothetical protein